MKKRIIPCVILARKGSKGLKNKNTYKLNGKPLISYTLEYALKCKFVSHIIVSTDDEKVNRIAKKYNCICIFPRPKKFSKDTSRSEPAILHALKYFEEKISKFDIYSYLQITEPFRPKTILNKCIKNLIENDKLDSSFAGYIYHKNFWQKKNTNFIKINKENKIKYLPRQVREPVVREDTGIALASRYNLIKKGLRVGKRVKIEEYSSFEGLVDIHNKKDIQLSNALLDKKLLD